MDRLILLTIMVLLIAAVVGGEALEPIVLAMWDLLCLCFTTSIWGKVVLAICGVLAVVCFIGE